MKLLRFKITDHKGFRSLPKNFEIYFLRDFDYNEADNFNPYVLAGTNGSGKSNVLEALAEIFFHLNCIYLDKKPDYFDHNSVNKKGFQAKKSRINAYELEYFRNVDRKIWGHDISQKAHVSIVKTKDQRPELTLIDHSDDSYFYKKEISRSQIKSLLPDYVVGYASGNNERDHFINCVNNNY